MSVSPTQIRNVDTLTVLQDIKKFSVNGNLNDEGLRSPHSRHLLSIKFLVKQNMCISANEHINVPWLQVT